MTENKDPFDGLVITLKPDATPEEIDRFLTDLARAIIAIARHLVALEEGDSPEEASEF